MTEKTRRQQIEEMLATDPHDEFLRYGLALELAREGSTSDAVNHLRALIADRPSYVPAYFQAAQLLLRLSDSPGAAELLRQGISVAQAQSNSHAASEMSALLAQLE
jgi:predicted Zn-dependent protease